MLLGRLIGNFRSQNWTAVTLELLVVFIGIFAAFQMDRWNEERLLRSVEDGHLIALAEDFAANRVSLNNAVSIHQGSVEAAADLLAYRPDDPKEMSHDSFYNLMRSVQYMGAWEPQRRAYDVLIASGEISIIQDDLLLADLAAYFARVARADDRHNEMIMQRVTSLEPFINKNLDHAALVLKVHPHISETLSPSLPLDQFRAVLGNAEFEGEIVTKMHASHDATSYYGRILELNTRIESRLNNLLVGR